MPLGGFMGSSCTSLIEEARLALYPLKWGCEESSIKLNRVLNYLVRVPYMIRNISVLLSSVSYISIWTYFAWYFSNLLYFTYLFILQLVYNLAHNFETKSCTGRKGHPLLESVFQPELMADMFALLKTTFVQLEQQPKPLKQLSSNGSTINDSIRQCQGPVDLIGIWAKHMKVKISLSGQFEWLLLILPC